MNVSFQLQFISFLIMVIAFIYFQLYVLIEMQNRYIGSVCSTLQRYRSVVDLKFSAKWKVYLHQKMCTLH